MMTRSQLRVYNALVVLTADGWPASVREIQDVAGYRSPSTVHHHLKTLERDGYAIAHPRRGGWLAKEPSEPGVSL